MITLNHCLGILENCHHASALGVLAKRILTWEGWLYLELLLPSSGGQYFGEAGRSVLLGHGSRRNYSVGIIKCEFQE